MGSKGTGNPEELEQFAQVRGLLEEIKAENACLRVTDLAVNGRDLIALGYTGKAIGDCLNALLERVLDETLPNERQALLQAAEREKR